MLKGKTGGELEVYICSDCGFVEFYLKNPSEVISSDLADKT